MRTSIFVFAILLSLIITTAAQRTTVNPVPIRPTPWASGKAMYEEYCAACHGNKADGHGPAEPALKTVPADLTMLARRNDGKFPYRHFDLVLRFGARTLAHRSKDMPVWAPLFASLNDGREVVVQQRIFNLARYVESLQK
jgi:mono/diheme cytochrome c family protein